ncbi:MAG: fhs [Anaerosporomusa subterranea]|jgi:formate--tetrahydrofolate ligase|nr:fhs [Anaerosporomusa subterranea]
MHGGVAKPDLAKPDAAAVTRGAANLAKHYENIAKFGVPAVVAVNIFPTDSQEELDAVLAICQNLGAPVALSNVWAEGGAGGIQLAEMVLALADSGQAAFAPLYPLELPLTEKARIIAKEIYGAEDVNFTKEAEQTLAVLTKNGYGNLPVCMAKTQYSFSDDPTRLGRPEGFTVTVRQARISAGAGFVVLLTGEIMTMPGLPKRPAAENIDIDANGRISGLF